MAVGERYDGPIFVGIDGQRIDRRTSLARRRSVRRIRHARTAQVGT
jgi:hypothetical protein